jgi:hypothetical protein
MAGLAEEKHFKVYMTCKYRKRMNFYILLDAIGKTKKLAKQPANKNANDRSYSLQESPSLDIP